ncbi:unnamed protein product [Gordionus sp. m RMFG-2023]
MILLKTTEPNGSCFIRTDQLDGETDWKSRKAIPYCQNLINLNILPSSTISLSSKVDMIDSNISNAGDSMAKDGTLVMNVHIEPPRKDIHNFFGTFTAQLYTKPEDFHNITSSSSKLSKKISVSNPILPKLVCKENLNIDFTMWSSCVLASEGSALGLVIYTGKESRNCMNSSQPRSKVGLTDLEINGFTKILFVSVLTLSILLMVLKGFSGPWYRYFVRFILLFSYIIPISLRVNMDLAKMAYAYMITKDKEMPGNVVRNTTIPEELGRIKYLFTDKTGTLTKNEMVFKRLYLGQTNRSFWPDTEGEISRQLKLAEAAYLFHLSNVNNMTKRVSTNVTQQSVLQTQNSQDSSKSLDSRAIEKNTGGHHLLSEIEAISPYDDLYETIKALCICNNVTPVFSQLSSSRNLDVSNTIDIGIHSSPRSIRSKKSLFGWFHLLFGFKSKRAQTDKTITTPSVNHRMSTKQTGPMTYQDAVINNNNNNRDSLTESVLSNSTCDSTSQLISENRLNNSVIFRSTDGGTGGGNINNSFSINSISSEDGLITYQASSPDEVALVTWARKVGIRLIHRDTNSLKIMTPLGRVESFKILKLIPFTSERKMMGLVVKQENTNVITYYFKGADSVISGLAAASLDSNIKNTFNRNQNTLSGFGCDKIAWNPEEHRRKRSDGVDNYNGNAFDWIDEESGNLAREGLRTLVIGRVPLNTEEYNQLSADLESRRHDNDVIFNVPGGRLEVLGITGVEDKLQDGVPHALEMLRNAGIKIWMLTGDKLETAVCIAKSSHLVHRNQSLFIFQDIHQNSSESIIDIKERVHRELNTYRAMKECNNTPIVMTGPVLEICTRYFEPEFMEAALEAHCVVICRASPTQKSRIVLRLPAYFDSASRLGRGSSKTPKLVKGSIGNEKCRACAVGDGGNDVGMIQTAHVGVGIAGKEGKQASLAADFSLAQFSHLARLILVHGRYSYKRTAALSQFIIHRGLIISTMQAVFSAIFFFASVALYQGYLMIGYSTIYTMFPVFSIILDRDVTPQTAMMYPELYKDLVKGRTLCYKTFFIWVLISIYQGSVIMIGAFLLFEDEFVHVVSITFTALIVNELLMVTLTVRRWKHWAVISAETFSIAVYLLSLVIFRDHYFDRDFVLRSSLTFVWKVCVVTLVSCVPLVLFKVLARKISPPIYAKLN